MKHKLELAILPQPNNTTCGPTCLHAIYKYFGDDISLDQVIEETHSLDAGGTYSVFLACHALRRGYRASIYTYNLRVFDPTWFTLSAAAMRDRLARRLEAMDKPRLGLVIRGFMDFIELGGEVDFEDLTTALVRKYLKRRVPILTGLSSTYLYRTMRERGDEMVDDDVRGDPQGHFVVLCGYDKEDRSVLVADPLTPNPAFAGLQYVVNIDRVICSILLGAITNDADVLIIEPPESEAESVDDEIGASAGAVKEPGPAEAGGHERAQKRATGSTGSIGSRASAAEVDVANRATPRRAASSADASQVESKNRERGLPWPS